jgi:catalase
MNIVKIKPLTKLKVFEIPTETELVIRFSLVVYHERSMGHLNTSILVSEISG